MKSKHKTYCKWNKNSNTILKKIFENIIKAFDFLKKIFGEFYILISLYFFSFLISVSKSLQKINFSIPLRIILHME